MGTDGLLWFVVGHVLIVVYLVAAVKAGLKVGRYFHRNDTLRRLRNAALMLIFAVGWYQLLELVHGVDGTTILFLEFPYWAGLIATLYLFFRPSKIEYP
jgi:hypothetical protein